MANPATIINYARWDLRDYGTGTDIADEELLVYLNRVIRILNNYLINIRSDHVYGIEEGIDTTADQNYISLTALNSGTWESIEEFWIGSSKKQKVTPQEIYYLRKFRSESAEPEYWALMANNINFEVDADDAHTDVVIHYWKRAAALTSTADNSMETMPYNDRYNDLIVQALVMMANDRHSDAAKRTDAVYYELFRKSMQGEALRRIYSPKPYRLDF